MLDHTHNTNATSWVTSANGHDQFPIQNLPLGIWNKGKGRIVIAIGDQALDVQAAITKGHLKHLDPASLSALQQPTLNAWMQLDAQQRLTIRHKIFELLTPGNPAQQDADHLLVTLREGDMAVPADIGDFTDFYCGIHHAIKAGSVFRPDNPLLPNYAYLPLAYHGRSSSINVSGKNIIRPHGQRLHNDTPELGPSQRLDFELELALWAGPGNPQGHAIPIRQAANHIAGYSLFNDWSARDIQAWEYRPLGPFQGKNFAATVAPWVITDHALAPFRCQVMPRMDNHPEPLDYLKDDADQKAGGLDITLNVFLSSEAMREQDLAPLRIAQSNSQHLYWTPAQMITQHTLSGCNLRAGDLIGTGTISTPDDSGNGSLLEMSQGGKRALTLPSGEQRLFLEDGDEVIFTGHCNHPDYYQIGFGECRARVLAKAAG